MRRHPPRFMDAKYTVHLSVTENNRGDKNQRAASHHLQYRKSPIGAEESMADHSDDHQLHRDDDVGKQERGMDIPSQERQSVTRTTDECHDTSNAAAQPRVASTGQRAVVRERLRE